MLNENLGSTKFAYSVEEVATKISMSKSHVRNEIRAKKLKAKKCGVRVLILEKDLQDYLNNQIDWEPSINNVKETN